MTKHIIWYEPADNGAIVKEYSDEGYTCSKVVLGEDKLDKELGRLIRDYIESSSGYSDLGCKVSIEIE